MLWIVEGHVSGFVLAGSVHNSTKLNSYYMQYLLY